MVFLVIKRYRLMLVTACLFSLTGAALGISVLALLNRQIASFDKFRPPLDEFFLLLGLIIAMVSVGILAQYLLARLSANVVATLRETLTGRILQADFEGLERIGGHRVYATLTGDIARISRGITVLPEYAYNISLVFLCLGYIGYLSVHLLGLLLIVIAAAIFIVRILLQRASLFLSALRKNDDELFDHYQTLVEGSKELNIRVYRKRFFYRTLLLPIISLAKDNSIKSQLNFAFLSNISNAFIFMAMVSLMFFASWLLPELKTETLVSVMLVFIFMVGPLGFVVDSFSSLADANVGYKGIATFEKILGETTDKSLMFNEPIHNENIKTNGNWQSITLSNIYYRYASAQPDEHGNFAVGPFSATFKRGEIIFITGGNGSGKSTFAKLLTGLYTPSAGKVFVDDQQIDYNADVSDYRQLFSTIFSDFYLFKQVLDGTGSLANDDDILEHLTQLELDKKVSSTEGTLSTIRLSHGQRKRLALLHAYLEDSPICIFDEWAADQDAHFRHYFYTQILPDLKRKNKLVIAISHDDRYFSCCDRLLKLEQGRIVENELVKSSAPVNVPMLELT